MIPAPALLHLPGPTFSDPCIHTYCSWIALGVVCGTNTEKLDLPTLDLNDRTFRRPRASVATSAVISAASVLLPYSAHGRGLRGLSTHRHPFPPSLLAFLLVFTHSVGASRGTPAPRVHSVSASLNPPAPIHKRTRARRMEVEERRTKIDTVCRFWLCGVCSD